MFCPQCGSTQSDELKFCKTCGANLSALRRLMATRDAEDEEGKFDWSKTWVAEMFMSSEEAVRREAELDRLQGKTPEVKRRNEIKAGVITASVGLGVMIVLMVIMQGVILGGRVSDTAAEILSRLWIVGTIPLLIGVALIVNGIFVSKPRAAEPTVEAEPANKEIEPSTEDQYLPPADTNELFPAGFSVTDETTRLLETPVKSKTNEPRRYRNGS